MLIHGVPKKKNAFSHYKKGIDPPPTPIAPKSTQ